MKPALLSALLVLSAGLALADDTLPIAPPASRYDKLAQHSPFFPPTVALPVAPPPPAPKGPGWADSLSIAAALQQGNSYMLKIADRDSAERFVVSTDPSVTNKRDTRLISVQWSDDLNQLQATVQKGAETAVLKYDAASAQASFGRPNLQPNVGSGARPLIPGMANRPPQVFNAPPAAGNSPNAISRTPIRATPPPQVQRPNVPLPHANPPGTKAAANADDDDDDE